MARRESESVSLERARADLDASEALYVGDPETDITAAQRAGIDSTFLCRDHVADVTLSVEPTAEVPAHRTPVAALTDQH